MRRLVLSSMLVAGCGLGLDQAKLDRLRDSLAARSTQTFLVVEGDRIVYEWYAPASGPSKPHYTASMAKALVGGMSLLVALSDGRIHPDDPAWKYIPAWKDDPKKARITIRHLATHSSGIEDAEEGGKPHADLTGWKGAFWKREPDPFSIAIRQAPLVFPPGTRYAYSNPGMAALAYAVTAAEGDDLRALLKTRIMDPLGVPLSDWSIGYGRAYDVDGLKLYANWGGGSYTARAVAAVGRLMLHHGNWNGRQLLDRAWVKQAVAWAGTPLPDRPPGNPNPASGLGWWTNYDGVWPAVPRDAFAGAGAGNQVLLVVPSLNLVVARNGELLGDTFWGGLETNLFNPLMDAVRSSPYPPSQWKAEFAPESSIVRQAIDSDNWPITWGDDDYQYTSYGDGWGFDPRTERKLSLGLARIAGGPADFRGENLRSPSVEREGDGQRGPKASGMLMANGILYMWARNVGNSQLAWSEDHGQTWQWGFRLESSFGSPTFLNFGKNYQGERDEYVYIYSQDGPSAYESDDRLVLARVRKDRIRDREAYEFFAGGSEWTAAIGRRGAVFTYPGHCQRADVVYNPGLKRYLLALGFNHVGGWGIFDAPEPWGPWTTVFHTANWGQGETHGYRLPAKWINAGGKTLYLVFSGRAPNDAFCVRRLTLKMEPPMNADKRQ